jgi:predicted GNAT family acetyltransferase
MLASMTGHTGEDEVAVEVVDNPDRGRFELREGEEVIGVARYAVVPGDAPDATDRVVFFHTEVRPDHEGRGLAARLASSALEATMASGRSIVALCPYIKVYLRRHPEPYAGSVVTPTAVDVEAAERAAAAER